MGVAVRYDICARTFFLAGCFTLVLAAAGLKPQPLQSGPLENHIGLVAEQFADTMRTRAASATKLIDGLKHKLSKRLVRTARIEPAWAEPEEF
jgi:hypothetical protein